MRAVRALTEQYEPSTSIPRAHFSAAKSTDCSACLPARCKGRHCNVFSLTRGTRAHPPHPLWSAPALQRLPVRAGDIPPAMHRRHHRSAPLPPAAPPPPTPPPDPCWTSTHSLVLLALLVPARIFAALLSPIADCDETFNYWEPAHFLLYRSGLQTWEYSPRFALRSYAFLYPYALVARLTSFLHGHAFPPGLAARIPVKLAQFYAVRLAQAAACAASELYLARAAAPHFGPRVALLAGALLAVSAGPFRASVELLPSSFAMIALTFALADWMAGRPGRAVASVALAAALGWVYAAVLAVPMALHMATSPASGGLLGLVRRTVASGGIVAAYMLAVDSVHFGRITLAPLNHVLYNVFPPPGAGSTLFGTDRWTYYAVNLVLNVGLCAPASAVFPLVLVARACVATYWRVGGGVAEKMAVVKRAWFLSPLYVALTVFFAQPHKEERFLAPCYPWLALVAAVCVDDVSALLCGAQAPTSHKKDDGDALRRPRIGVGRVALATAFAIVCAALGVSRATRQVVSLSAPMHAYAALGVELARDGRNLGGERGDDDADVNVCVREEWYRFPSSFFLPERRHRLRFLRGATDGMLPMPFDEGALGTRGDKVGFNGYNSAVDEQFFGDGAGDSEERCHYIVEFVQGGQENGSEEVGKDLVVTMPFMNATGSAAGFRAFYIHGYEWKIQYGEYRVRRVG